MSSLERNWQFVEQFHAKAPAELRARRLSQEFGLDPVTSAIAAQLSLLTRLMSAQRMLEIGTGVGVSGLALLSGSQDATLTTIDIESEYLKAAKEHFTIAGFTPGQIRTIAGDALEVLPRMDLSSYDVALVDADPDNMLEYVEFSLRTVRPGGLIIVPHALWNGTVSDPAQRGQITEDFRTLLDEIAQSDAVDSQLSPIGDGLLVITKSETT